MKLSSYNINITPKSDMNKEDSTDRLMIGGTLVLGASFDIKQYLNNIQYLQKTNKGQKSYFPPFMDNLYKRTKLRNKKYELSTVTNGYSPKKKNKFFERKNPSLDGSTTATNYNYTATMRNYKNSSFNTNNDNYSTPNDRLKSYKSTKDYFETESNTKSLFSYKYNNLYNSGNENLNLLKTIKNIKKSIDMSHKDKSINSILNSKIVYDPKNEDAVFRPIKIINEFKNFEKRDLDKKKYDITSFITDSQQISKRNVILKLLDDKKKNCIKNMIKRQKLLESNKKTIDIDEINFECYTTNQKQANKRIEKKLTDLLYKTRRLLLEERKFKSDLRVKEDERQRYLEQIDELRIIAKFVNKVIGNNMDLLNLLKIKILPEYSAERLPNYEKIGKEVIERFHFFLDEDEINDINSKKSKFNQKDENILREMHSLNNFELFYDQFYEVERKIINSMKEKKEINNEIIEMEKEERKNIAEIQKAMEHFKNELNIIQSEYDKERTIYEHKLEINEIGNLDYDGIVYDLYFEVMFIFGKLKLNKDNKIIINKEAVGVNDALREIRSLIIDSEEKMNKYMELLETYEKSDKFLFGRICNHIKNSHKEKKVNLQKQIIADGEKQKIDQMMENKIIFINRKAEPPFHLPKKEKKIKIDPELVKQLENEELITYK